MSDTRQKAYFPIFLDLSGKPCIVVGGGEVAARKVQSLLEAEAVVTVISPSLTETLQQLSAQSKINHIARQYAPGDLEGARLVFAATDKAAVNHAVSREAEDLGLLYNVVDDPAHCGFIVPARINRDPISIAVSTQAASPALASHLRRLIEEAVPPEYALLARLMSELRADLMGHVSSQKERKRLWQKLMESDVIELLRQGQEAQAKSAARQILGLPADAQEDNA